MPRDTLDLPEPDGPSTATTIVRWSDRVAGTRNLKDVWLVGTPRGYPASAVNHPSERDERLDQPVGYGGRDGELDQADGLPGRVLDADVLDVDPGVTGV